MLGVVDVPHLYKTPEVLLAEGEEGLDIHLFDVDQFKMLERLSKRVFNICNYPDSDCRRCVRRSCMYDMRRQQLCLIHVKQIAKRLTHLASEKCKERSLVWQVFVFCYVARNSIVYSDSMAIHTMKQEESAAINDFVTTESFSLFRSG